MVTQGQPPDDQTKKAPPVDVTTPALTGAETQTTTDDADQVDEVGTRSTSVVGSSLAIGETESGTGQEEDFDTEVARTINKIKQAAAGQGIPSDFGDDLVVEDPDALADSGLDTNGSAGNSGNGGTAVPDRGTAPAETSSRAPLEAPPVVTNPAQTTDVAQAPAEVAREIDYRSLVSDKIEGLPKFENLTPEQLRNFQLYRQQFLKLMPVVRIDEQVGEHQNQLQVSLVALHTKEENPDRRKKLEELLESDPFSDRSKALQELRDLYGKDSPDFKIVEDLIAQENGKGQKVQILDRITWNEQNQVLFESVKSDEMSANDKAECYRTLMDRYSGNPEKQSVIRDNYAQMLIQELKSAGADAKTSPALQELARLYPDDKAITQLLLDFKAGKNENALTEIQGKIPHGARDLETVQNDAKAENYELMMASYGKVSEFLKGAVPQSIIAFDRMLPGLSDDQKLNSQFPDDCPIELPKVAAGRNQYPATWKGFIEAVKAGDAKLTLPDQPQSLLAGGQTLDQFQKACNFWTNAESIIARNQRIHDATNLNKLLKEDFGAGPGWEMPPVTDADGLDSWHSAALDMTNLLMRIKNYTQAYKSLEGIAPDVNRDHAIEELRKLGAKIEFDPRTDKLTVFELPLPGTLNTKHPRNSDQVRALENWLAQHKEPVDKAIEAFKKGHSSHLRYGDFIEPGTIVYDKDNPSRMLMILDHSGEPTTLFHRVGDKDVAVHRNTDGKFMLEERTTSGEKVEREIQPDMSQAGRTKDFQYTRQWFSTAEVKDEITGETKIQVTINRMPCVDNAANYQYFGSDIDANFNTNLCAIEGAQFTETRLLNPKDYVGTVHNTVGRLEVMRADDLHNGWWKWRQQNLFHYGAKAGNVGLDVGLLVSGSVEAFAAKSVVRAALPAARALIGASGFLAPALRTGAIEPFGIKGETWLKARHIAMMVDVYGFGLGGSALKMFTGGGKAAAETVGVLDKIAHTAHTFTNVTGFLYGPIILRGIADKWNSKHGRLAEQRIPRAMIERGIAESDYSTFSRYDMTDSSVRQETAQMLDGMKSGLKTNNPETNRKLDQLFENAKEILALPQDDPRRQKFIQQLVGYHRPSAENVLADRMRQDSLYTTDIVQRDREGNPIPDAKADENRKLLEQLTAHPTLLDVSEQEKTASAQLLLLLAADADGALPQDGVLGKRQFDLPDHNVKRVETISEYEEKHTWDKPTESERRVEQTFTVDDALSLLHARVTDTPENAVEKLSKGSIEDVAKYLQMQLGVNPDVAKSFAQKLVSGDEETRKTLEARLSTPLKTEQLASADYLWRLGKLSNREMAAVAMEIFMDKSLPADLRGSALVDSSGYRLGALMADLKAEELQIGTMSGADKMASLGNIYGTRSSDVENALIRMISADGLGPDRNAEPADLRALAARVLSAQKSDSLEARLTQLKDIGQLWTNRSQKPGEFARQLVDELRSNIEMPVAHREGMSIEDIQRQKLESTLILSALGNVDFGGGDYYKLSRSEYNQRLLEATSISTGQIVISETNPEITHQVLTSLDYNSLTNVQRQQILNVLDMPSGAGGGGTETASAVRRRDIEVSKILVLRNLKSLTGEGQSSSEFDQLRSSAQQKVLNLFGPPSTFATGQPELRLEAVRAVRDLGWRDHRIKEMLEGRLQQGSNPGSNEKYFYEPSAAVRRTALEALWKMNPSDPGRVALEHKDVEHDPVAARIDEMYRSKMEQSRRGDARQESEIAQATQYDLTDPLLCDDERGRKLLEDPNSEFRLLLYKNLLSELENKLEGQYSFMIGGIDVKADLSVEASGLSFGVGWDRVCNFDWDAPSDKLQKAYRGIMDNYQEQDRALVRKASTPGNTPETLQQQIDAINAMGYLLENLDTVGSDDSDRFFIAQNLAMGLKQLTAGESVMVDGQAVHVPQQVADSAFRWSRRLLRDNNVDSGVRLQLLEGLRTLHNDGRISTTEFVGVLNDALRMGHENRDFGRAADAKDRLQDEKLHSRMLEDYLRLQIRTPEVKGHLLAYSRRHPYNMDGDGHINVRRQAEHIYQLLDQGVTLAREDARKLPDLGSSAEDRAANLHAAVERYGKKVLEKDSSGVAIENASDELVHEVFRSMTGVPVTSMSDARIAVLQQLGNHTDVRVRAAAAHALIDADFGNGRLALDGYSALKRIADDPSLKQSMPGLVWETNKRLDTIRNLGDRGDKFLNQLSSSQSSSLLSQFNAAGQSNQSLDALTEELARLGPLSASGNLGDQSSYLSAITAAWTKTGGTQEQNEKLIDTTNLILDSSAPAKVRVMAALALIRSEVVSEPDKKYAEHQLTKIKEQVTDVSLRNDIDRIIARDFADREDPAIAAMATEAAALNAYAPFDVAYRYGDEEKRVEFERLKGIAEKLGGSSRDWSSEHDLMFSIKMLAFSQEYKNPQFVEWLDKIKRGEIKVPDSVRDVASQASAHLHGWKPSEGTAQLLEDTMPDTTTPKETKALMIKEQLGVDTTSQRFDAEVVCREIFRLAHPETITTEDDPRRAVLDQALEHKNERVRMAAARVLLAVDPTNPKATGALIELLDAESAVMKTEAHNLLESAAPIESADDPRRRVLFEGLDHVKEQVRLSSAWMLSRSQREGDFDIALSTLSNMAMKGKESMLIAGDVVRTDEAARMLMQSMVYDGSDQTRDKVLETWGSAFRAYGNQDANKRPPQFTEVDQARKWYRNQSQDNSFLQGMTDDQKKAILMSLMDANEDQVNAMLTPSMVAFEDAQSQFRFDPFKLNRRSGLELLLGDGVPGSRSSFHLGGTDSYYSGSSYDWRQRQKPLEPEAAALLSVRQLARMYGVEGVDFETGNDGLIVIDADKAERSSDSIDVSALGRGGFETISAFPKFTQDSAPPPEWNQFVQKLLTESGGRIGQVRAGDLAQMWMNYLLHPEQSITVPTDGSRLAVTEGTIYYGSLTTRNAPSNYYDLKDSDWKMLSWSNMSQLRVEDTKQKLDSYIAYELGRTPARPAAFQWRPAAKPEVKAPEFVTKPPVENLNVYRYGLVDTLPASLKATSPDTVISAADLFLSGARERIDDRRIKIRIEPSLSSQRPGATAIPGFETQTFTPRSPQAQELIRQYMLRKTYDGMTSWNKHILRIKRGTTGNQ